MSFKDTLKARRESAVAVFHKFRTSVRPDENIHIFVEGYEDVMYLSLIADLLTSSYDRPHDFHICFGKKNLDRVISIFRSSTLLSRKVIFIRDSDFDKFLGLAPTDEDLFLTCGYSVENYVCSKQSLERFIRRSFGVDPDEVKISDLVDYHLACIDQVFSVMEDFLGAVLFAIRSGSQLDLDQISVSDIYLSIYDVTATIPAISSDVMAKCKLQTVHFNDESRALGAAFVQQDSEWWLRGKFTAECTALFLGKLSNDLRAKYKSGKISRFNRRSMSTFNATSVFEILAPSSIFTERLSKFLEERFKLPLVS